LLLRFQPDCDDGIEGYLSEFGNLANLRRLNFDLTGSCEIDLIDNSGIVSFAIRLKRLLSFQEVSFVFQKNLKNSNAERELFIEVLKSHKSLKKIYMDFDVGGKSFVEEVKDGVEEVWQTSLETKFGLFVGCRWNVFVE